MNSQIHTPAAAPTEITHGTQKVRGWVGSSAILRVLEKRKALPPLQHRNLGSFSPSSSHYTDYATRDRYRRKDKIKNLLL